ncbi:hypothetical protein N7520_009668 [Penicillium odoratum]|uniref:uncharacterized protein n=1 Tax=Penicillium odoratum TaxID=1167516 RepID=UPI002548F464|nr:uncharacterized protein N7520_009668 [Penicillium odoratum]KAJ5752751.1 hypothetical protein N7520_009668 [Penicillium odoratum]
MADDWQQSIFEMSVINSELFNACWTKIESIPDLDLSNVLKHEHYASRGCWPYSTEAGHVAPLLVAAQHDRFEATSWLLWNNDNVCEQRSCAVAATVRQTKDSARILHLVMMRMSLAGPLRPPSWPQDIAVEVIRAACNQNQMGRPEILEYIQDLAFRKIGSVKASAPDLLSYSKESLSSAKEAGLTDLVDFLRAGNKEAWKTLPNYC